MNVIGAKTITACRASPRRRGRDQIVGIQDRRGWPQFTVLPSAAKRKAHSRKNRHVATERDRIDAVKDVPTTRVVELIHRNSRSHGGALLRAIALTLRRKIRAIPTTSLGSTAFFCLPISELPSFQIHNGLMWLSPVQLDPGRQWSDLPILLLVARAKSANVNQFTDAKANIWSQITQLAQTTPMKV